MGSIADRKYRRVFVGPEITIRFELEGKIYQDINLANLSEGGCFALIPGPLSKPFAPGKVLENFQLIGPRLHPGSIRALIRSTLGTDDESMEFAGAGLEFNDVDAPTARALSEFVDSIPEFLF